MHYNKSEHISSSMFFPEFTRHSCKWIHNFQVQILYSWLTEGDRGGCWNLWSYSLLVRSTGDNIHLCCHLKCAERDGSPVRSVGSHAISVQAVSELSWIVGYTAGVPGIACCAENSSHVGDQKCQKCSMWGCCGVRHRRHRGKKHIVGRNGFFPPQEEKNQVFPL